MNQTVELFNGEPIIGVTVIKSPEIVYQFATKKHGLIRTGNKQFVEDFMKESGHQYKYIKGREGRDY